MLKNKKLLVLLAVILVIIMVGVIVLGVKGMNYSLLYGANTQIEMYLENDFELEDIKAIAKETFGKNNIRLLDESKHDILITVKSASEEQQNNLISKVNEKYGLELSTQDLIVVNNGEMKLTDLISRYVFPVIIASLVILAYFIIRYRKLKLEKVVLYTLITIIGLQFALLIIYAITRIPVNSFTMPISMLIFILSVLGLTEYFDNQIKNTSIQ